MKELDWTDYDVLVVDDEPDNLDAFRFAFRKSFKLHYATGAQDALSALATTEPAVIVADQRMPGMNGIELLAQVKERYPDTYAILLTAYADIDVLVEAVNSGAVDRYVQKPWQSKEFTVILRQGIDAAVTRRENRRLREQVAQYAGYLDKQRLDPIDLGQIIGAGEAARRVLSRVEEVAPTTTPVVIEGEQGLEKNVVARAIHIGSSREDKPFVSVTCAAFPGDALERELFGYCKGSFDGAFQDRSGRFELADGGTLWLHEPVDLSKSLQAKLLRALVDGEVERQGETTSRHVDVRLVMSVNPTLRDVLGSDALAELRSRLSVFPIGLEPLRRRREDVRPLAEHFLRKYAQRNARAATSMSAEALVQLESYDWPGNVRELENVVERAAILARGDVIEPSHLSFQSMPKSDAQPPGEETSDPKGLTLSRRLDAIERSELIKALEKYNGNKAEVARVLGIHRTTLYYRLKKLGIDA